MMQMKRLRMNSHGRQAPTDDSYILLLLFRMFHISKRHEREFKLFEKKISIFRLYWIWDVSFEVWFLAGCSFKGISFEKIGSGKN